MPKPPTQNSPSDVQDEGKDAAVPGRREELELVRRGDPEALGRFFDQHFPSVYGLVLRLVGDVTTAEDITQEVFLKTHRAIGSLDPTRDPAPWLTTIAYNCCRDMWRSAGHRMRRQSMSLDEKPELGRFLAAAGGNPEVEALRAERAELVQEAIGQLPEQQREIVMLHDYQGMTHDAIAQMVGASHAAVRKRYSRALTALGKILSERLT
jgi:RNA polymerase sigma factor (sigma-70 family)